MGGHDSALVFFDFDGGFLDVGSLEGAEVVGGFEAFVPGAAIHVAEDFEVRGGEEEVDRLRLVDPLLATRGGVHDVLVVDAEDSFVFVFDRLRDAIDVLEFAIEVFQLIDHFRAPEIGFLEVADEFGVEDGEIAGEVGFDVEVFVVRLDARGGAHDVGDRRGRGDGENVGVAHAVFGDFLSNNRPIHFSATRDIDLATALVFEEVDGVLREKSPAPLGTFVRRVGADFRSEIAAGAVGVVGDGFHHLVVELNRGIRSEGEVAFVEGVLETHDAEADGAVAGVRGFRGVGWVEVDVDDVVERTDRHGDGFLEHLVIEGTIGIDVGIEHDGTEVTNGGFLVGGIEGDLGAKVAGVDDAAMILWGADVARVFEGDPWVAGFEDHFQHAFPKLKSRHAA